MDGALASEAFSFAAQPDKANIVASEVCSVRDNNLEVFHSVRSLKR
jgi:hypothetical protein